jgi:hypothetical protein
LKCKNIAVLHFVLPYWIDIVIFAQNKAIKSPFSNALFGHFGHLISWHRVVKWERDNPKLGEGAGG